MIVQTILAVFLLVLAWFLLTDSDRKTDEEAGGKAPRPASRSAERTDPLPQSSGSPSLSDTAHVIEVFRK